MFSRYRWRCITKEEGSGASSQKGLIFVKFFVVFFCFLSLVISSCHVQKAFGFRCRRKVDALSFLFPSHHNFLIEAEWSGEENTLLFYWASESVNLVEANAGNVAQVDACG